MRLQASETSRCSHLLVVGTHCAAVMLSRCSLKVPRGVATPIGSVGSAQTLLPRPEIRVLVAPMSDCGSGMPVEPCGQVPHFSLLIASKPN